MKKLFKIILSTIKTLLVVIVTLVFIVIATQRIFNNKISLFGYRIFTVVTKSMEPDYKVSDIIVSKKIDQDQLKVGDDVVYLGNTGSFENKVITHRIIEIEEDEAGKEFYTQGIANTGVDPAISGDQIYGVVVGKSNILTFISSMVSSPIGFLLFVILPGSILISSEIFSKTKNEEGN